MSRILAPGRLRRPHGGRCAMIACLAPMAALIAARCVADEAAPWPSSVPGFVAPQPGEHPRLLFRRGDLPALRRRAATPEGQAIVTRLRKLLNGSDGESMPTAFNPERAKPSKDGSGPTAAAPAGMYTFSHAAGFGFLFQLTGDKKYADLGRQCMEKAFEHYRDRDNRYAFKDPYGALRAGPVLGWTALGYDLCYDGWDEAYRRKVALALQNYNEGPNMSLAELVRGSRHMPGSNHWGMQVGGGALALLAILNDPGIDMVKLGPLVETSQKAMLRNMTEGFGDGGFFAEGDGPGSMSSQIAFVPALQAWKVAAGNDFISPRTNAPWMTLKWIFLTVPRNGSMDFPKRGGYPHNVWARDGLSGGGYFSEGFGGVTEPQRAALLWFYNHHLKALDEKNGTPFDTPSPYPHHAILALVNWPMGMAERNPGDVLPHAMRDTRYGFYMFRNRWQDEDDIVISVQTRSARGWIKASTDGSIEVWGLGKKARWGRIANDVVEYRAAPDGSAVLAAKDGTCLAIDFSKASGADAMLVMLGPGAGPASDVKLGGAVLRFKFLCRNTEPTPKVEADRVVVGQQVVRVENGQIALETMAAKSARGP